MLFATSELAPPATAQSIRCLVLQLGDTDRRQHIHRSGGRRCDPAAAPDLGFPVPVQQPCGLLDGDHRGLGPDVVLQSSVCRTPSTRVATAQDSQRSAVHAIRLRGVLGSARAPGVVAESMGVRAVWLEHAQIHVGACDSGQLRLGLRRRGHRYGDGMVDLRSWHRARSRVGQRRSHHIALDHRHHVRVAQPDRLLGR